METEILKKIISITKTNNGHYIFNLFASMQKCENMLDINWRVKEDNVQFKKFFEKMVNKLKKVEQSDRMEFTAFNSERELLLKAQKVLSANERSYLSIKLKPNLEKQLPEAISSPVLLREKPILNQVPPAPTKDLLPSEPTHVTLAEIHKQVAQLKTKSFNSNLMVSSPSSPAKSPILNQVPPAPTKDLLPSEPTHVTLAEIHKQLAQLNTLKNTEQPRLWGQGDYVRTNTPSQKRELKYLKEEENAKQLEQNKPHNSYKHSFQM